MAMPLKEMANDKLPSHDGYPCEFYKRTQDFEVPDLLFYKCRKKLFKLMHLGKHIKMKIKFITLLEASNMTDQELVTSWWPITLWNVSYKSLAKSLTLRLKYIMLKIIKTK